jgi:hypothetical protein
MAGLAKKSKRLPASASLNQVLIGQLLEAVRDSPSGHIIPLLRDDIRQWYVLIVGLDDDFKYGEYLFTFTAPDEFPDKSPIDLHCLTPNGVFGYTTEAALVDPTRGPAPICISAGQYHDSVEEGKRVDNWRPSLGMLGFANCVVSALLCHQDLGPGFGIINNRDPAEIRRFAFSSQEYNQAACPALYNNLDTFIANNKDHPAVVALLAARLSRSSAAGPPPPPSVPSVKKPDQPSSPARVPLGVKPVPPPPAASKVVVVSPKVVPPPPPAVVVKSSPPAKDGDGKEILTCGNVGQMKTSTAEREHRAPDPVVTKMPERKARAPPESPSVVTVLPPTHPAVEIRGRGSKRAAVGKLAVVPPAQFVAETVEPSVDSLFKSDDSKRSPESKMFDSDYGSTSAPSPTSSSFFDDFELTTMQASPLASPWAVVASSTPTITPVSTAPTPLKPAPSTPLKSAPSTPLKSAPSTPLKSTPPAPPKSASSAAKPSSSVAAKPSASVAAKPVPSATTLSATAQTVITPTKTENNADMNDMLDDLLGEFLDE